MHKRRFYKLILLVFSALALSVGAFAQTGPQTFSAPTLLEAPVRTFLLSLDGSPQNGKPLESLEPIDVAAPAWLCGEMPSNRLLLFRPARPDAHYRFVSLSEGGSIARDVTPVAEVGGADALLRLPGDPDIICRMLSADEPPVTVGLASYQLGSYVWEDYQDALKDWASQAVSHPSRPPNPPTTSPSSLPDRLWFLAMWLQANADMQPTDKIAAEAFLRRAALWEILRIRPLNNLAFGLDDVSDLAGASCVSIPEETDRRFCRGEDAIALEISGPAILHVSLRPEVRVDPTPILEEAALIIHRDTTLLADEPVPIYPDNEVYPPDEWLISARPLMSPANTLLGKKTTVRVMVPPGSHQVRIQFPKRAAWWALTVAKPLTHLEDAARGNERLDFQLAAAPRTHFERFVAAEDAFRVGDCKTARSYYLEDVFAPSGNADLKELAMWRADSCRPEGEVLVPARLADAMRVLGASEADTQFVWEDRSGEPFRKQQIAQALASYRYHMPGLDLLPVLRSGAPPDALAVASQRLWYLDSLWMALEPPDAQSMQQRWVFQQRAATPDLPPLPSGLSMMQVDTDGITTRSRLVDGIARKLLLVTSGQPTKSETRIHVGDTPFVLLDELPVQSHPLLTAGDMFIKKSGNQPRKVWVQMRLSDRDDSAEAKLVRIWPLNDAGIAGLTPPDSGYAGYALLQLFPPVDAPAQQITVEVSTSGSQQTISLAHNATTASYPILDSEDARIGYPYSMSLPLGKLEGPIAVTLHGKDVAGWYVRLLVRVPRPPEESLWAGEKYSSGRAPTPDRTGAYLEQLEFTSAVLAAPVPSQATPDKLAMSYLGRADLLCTSGLNGLARADLLQAAKLIEQPDEQLRALLLQLKEKLDVGACQMPPDDPQRFPMALDATLQADNAPSQDLTLRLRAFAKARAGGDMQHAEALCRELVLDPQDPQISCLPWWGVWMGRRVLAGQPLEQAHFPMIIALLKLSETSNWAGLDRWRALLMRMTYWRPIPSPDRSAGIRSLVLDAESDSDTDNPLFVQTAKVIADDPHLPDPNYILFPGSALASSLPTTAPENLLASLGCRLLMPDQNAGDGHCRFTLRADGRDIAAPLLRDGETTRVEIALPQPGDHLLEIIHESSTQNGGPVAQVRLVSRRPISGITANAQTDGYPLMMLRRSTYWVATARRPVTVSILGPTLVKVELRTPKGLPDAANVLIRDSSGQPQDLPMQLLPGSAQIWLPDASAYTLEIEPNSDSQPLLTRVFYRDLNDRPLASVTATSERPKPDKHSSGVTDNSFALVGDFEPDTWDDWGILTLMAGFARKLRDESGGLAPLDHYLFARAAYARRIEPDTFWLRIDGEGRYRFDGRPSGELTGRLVYTSPYPSEITLEIADSVAVQQVQTGLAAGNLASLSLSRRFELAPTVSLTPELSGYYKWQALNDWREQLAPEQIDSAVYSAYLRDHPYAAALGLTASWQPWINGNFFGSVQAVSNADFKMLDYVRVRIGDRMAFERLQILLFYDLQPRFADDDRDAFYLRQQLHGGLAYSFWPRAMLRIAPFLDYDYHINDNEHALFGGLRFDLSPKRGLRDLTPWENFSWQIDPHRRWVNP